MKEILLRGKAAKGLVALVDDELFEVLNRYKWHVDDKGYCRYDYCLNDGKGSKVSIKMHHLAFGYPLSGYVDHINNCKQDNRLCNLRLATHGQNRMNSDVNKNNSTGYRGVNWRENKKKYEVTVGFEGKHVYITSCEDKEEAAYIRDQAALQLQGDFARTETL